jgi:RAB protein geranylgeranyltransferase component A
MSDITEDPKQKELRQLRKGKDDLTLQQIRKQISPSSRFLDNYFNAKIHPKFFMPNGQFTIKQ